MQHTENTPLVSQSMVRHKHGTLGAMLRGFPIGCPVGGTAGCLISYFLIGYGLITSLACGIPVGAAAGGLACCGYFKRKKEVEATTTVQNAPVPHSIV